MTNNKQKIETTKEEILTAFFEYQKAKELSLTEMATLTRVSTATLSKLTRHQWNDITDAMWRKIWVKVSEGKDLIVQTKDFTAIQNACDTARKNHYMLGIVGDTGTGKTTALEMYSRQKNVFYVAYDKTMKAKQFFIELLREMSIAFDGNLHEMVNKVADEVNTLENPLIVIDEAGKLTHNMILFLQVLRDKTNKNCGIVLAGMPYFQNNLIKNANKQKEGFAEFLRRVNIWHELEGLSAKEIEFVGERYGIEDKNVLKGLKSKKRFGDLVNEILIHQIDNNE